MCAHTLLIHNSLIAPTREARVAIITTTNRDIIKGIAAESHTLAARYLYPPLMARRPTINHRRICVSTDREPREENGCFPAAFRLLKWGYARWINHRRINSIGLKQNNTHIHTWLKRRSEIFGPNKIVAVEYFGVETDDGQLVAIGDLLLIMWTDLSTWFIWPTTIRGDYLSSVPLTACIVQAGFLFYIIDIG